MELVASLPADCLAATDPLARGPAPLPRPPDAEGAASPLDLPFDLFLQLFDSPLPGGEVLPVDGNGLPVPQSAWPVPAGTAPPLPAADSAASAAPPTEILEGGAFERFRLTAALRAIVPAPQPVASEPGVAAAVPTTGDALPSAPDFESDGPQPLSAAPAPLRGAPGAETPALSPQAALAGLAAEAKAAADEGRGRTRPAAMSTLQSAASAELEAVAVPSRAPAAAAIAAAPVAETSAAGIRAVRRDAGVSPLPLAANAADAAGLPGTETSTAWHLPAAPSTTTASGAAPTAAPAAHGPAVDTRSPNWHEAFAGRMQWLVDHKVGEARIKLNPPELGAVDVKISLVDDKTYVQLTAGNAATRDELTQSLPRLRELLTASGLDVGGAAVHSGHGGRGGYDEPAARGTASLEALGSLGEDTQFLHRPRREAGRIDTFA